MSNENLDNKNKKGENSEVKDNDFLNNDSSKTKVENSENNKVFEVDKNSEVFKDAVSKEVENIIKSRIDREVQKTRTIEEELKNLKNSSKETFDENDTLKNELDNLNKDNIIYKVSLEEGLDIDIVKSLKGSTYEELKKSSENIKKLKKENVKNSSSSLFNGKDYKENNNNLDFEKMLKTIKR